MLHCCRQAPVASRPARGAELTQNGFDTRHWHPPHHCRLVQDGTLHPDGSQVAAVQALELLQGVLAGQVAGSGTDSSSSSNGGGNGGNGGPTTVRGAYMWGPVGRGKTTIMDLFARTMPPGVVVRRHHLGTLLAHVGAAGGGAAAAEDVAARVADECHLLCIEKLAVQGPAEATAASRLLEALLREGCWLAFTVRCARVCLVCVLCASCVRLVCVLWPCDRRLL